MLIRRLLLSVMLLASIVSIANAGDIDVRYDTARDLSFITNYGTSQATVTYENSVGNHVTTSVSPKTTISVNGSIRLVE